MDRVPNWVWWTIAGGVLLSPVFAFLLAVLVEILIGVLTQGGVPALLLAAVVVSGGGGVCRRPPGSRGRCGAGCCRGGAGPPLEPVTCWAIRHRAPAAGAVR